MTRHLLACSRSLVLGVLGLAGAVVPLSLAAVVAAPVAGCAFALADPGPVPVRLSVAAASLLLGLASVASLIPLIAGAARWVATPTRILAGRWCGISIAVPAPAAVPTHLTLPAGSGGDGVDRTEQPAAPVFQRLYDRLCHALADPDTRRNLLWLVVNGCTGGILAAPAALAVLGVVAFIGPTIGPPIAIPAPAFPGNAPATLIAIGVGFIALAVWASPWLLRGYGTFAGLVLAGGQADLTRQVDHLARTRTEAIDTATAEMRRIERDLHDGAQARLVAIGMTLDAASQALDGDPETVRALLDEARTASASALTELRNLVRGIHPPVLADRGLTDALRALAFDSPVPAQVIGHLPARAHNPVESAAYFAVSELLANIAKHAHANHIGIDIRHTAGTLRIAVNDDGRGGADPAHGTGLRGIQRRLAAFDGILTIDSPPGGPTIITMEIPCALSWPKTSSSSVTA